MTSQACYEWMKRSGFILQNETFETEDDIERTLKKMITDVEFLLHIAETLSSNRISAGTEVGNIGDDHGSKIKLFNEIAVSEFGISVNETLNPDFSSSPQTLSKVVALLSKISIRAQSNVPGFHIEHIASNVEGGSHQIETGSDSGRRRIFSLIDASLSSGNGQKVSLAKLVVTDLIESEQKYVDQLRVLNEDFRKPMSHYCSAEAIFKYIKFLYGMHTVIYSKISTINVTKEIDCDDYRILCRAITEAKEDFLVYAKYCENSPRVLNLLEIMKLNDASRTLLEKCNQEAHRTHDGDLLLRLNLPKQRITKYMTLLRFLLLNHKGDSCYTYIFQGHEVISDLSENISTINKDQVDMEVIEKVQNELVNKGLPTNCNLSGYGRLRMKGEAKIRYGGSSKDEKRYLYLFDQAIIVTSNKFTTKYSEKYERKVDLINATPVLSTLRSEQMITLNSRGSDSPILAIILKPDNAAKWLEQLKIAISTQHPLGYGSNHHGIKMKTFVDFKKCFVCKKMLLGCFYQGYEYSGNAYHKECLKLIDDKCSVEVNDSHKLKASLKENTRQHLISEILETEGNFVEVLETLVYAYKVPLYSVWAREDVDSAFKLIEDLYSVHERIHTNLTIATIPGEDLDGIIRKLADVFIESQKSLLTHGKYAACINDALSLIKNNEIKMGSIHMSKCAANSKKFRCFDINDLMTRPTQRCMKYHLLLENLLDCVEIEHPNYTRLQKAYDAMIDMSGHANKTADDCKIERTIKDIQHRMTRMHMSTNKQLTDYGRLRMDGDVHMSYDNYQWKIGHIFVFDMIVITATRIEDKFIFGSSYFLKNSKPFEYNMPNIDRNDFAREFLMTLDLEDKIGRRSLHLKCQSEEEYNIWKNAVASAVDCQNPVGYNMSGYDFEMKTFRDIEWCCLCRRLFLGVFYQGYRCRNTGVLCHKDCISQLTDPNALQSCRRFSDEGFEQDHVFRSSKISIKADESLEIENKGSFKDLPRMEPDKREFISEIEISEDQFTMSLEKLLQDFKDSFSDLICKDKLDQIFLNIEKILKFHRSIYLQLRESRQMNSERIMCITVSTIFKNIKNNMELYGTYCANLPLGLKTAEEVVTENYNDIVTCVAKDHQLLAKDEMKSTLKNLLELPKIKLLNYHLQVEDLLSKTLKSDPDYNGLLNSHKDMVELARFVTLIEKDHLSILEIKKLEAKMTRFYLVGNKLSDFGRLQIEGEVLVTLQGNSIKMLRNVFIFDKLVIISVNKGGNLEFEAAFFLQCKAPEIKSSKKVQNHHVKVYVYRIRNEFQNISLFFDSEGTCLRWHHAIDMSVHNQYPQLSTRNGFQFEMKTFDGFVTCFYCKKILGGVFFQGYQCRYTSIISHKNCLPQDVKIETTVTMSQRRNLNSYSKERWYVGDLNREKCNDMLRNTCPGTFMIRWSVEAQRLGTYVLSFMERKPRHIEIKIRGTNLVIKDGLTFTNLRELVNFFKTKSIANYVEGMEMFDLKLRFAIREVLPPYSLYNAIAIEDSPVIDVANILEFHKGDVIRILEDKSSKDGWLLGASNNVKGYVKETSIKKLI